VEHPPLPGLVCLMEPFGASRKAGREANPLKEMVGTRRLELLTSTLSILRSATQIPFPYLAFPRSKTQRAPSEMPSFDGELMASSCCSDPPGLDCQRGDVSPATTKEVELTGRATTSKLQSYPQETSGNLATSSQETTTSLFKKGE
jgi:hypothetical protein